MKKILNIFSTESTNSTNNTNMKTNKQINIKVSENLYNFLMSETNRLQNSLSGVTKMYLKYGLNAHQPGRFERIQNGEVKNI